MLVNVDKVYSYIVSIKKSELRRTLSRCVCPQNNERQQRKPVIDGIRNKKEKKSKNFKKKSDEKKLVVSRTE